MNISIKKKLRKQKKIWLKSEVKRVRSEMDIIHSELKIKKQELVAAYKRCEECSIE
jgi:hypothetical protein